MHIRCKWVSLMLVVTLATLGGCKLPGGSGGGGGGGTPPVDNSGSAGGGSNGGSGNDSGSNGGSDTAGPVRVQLGADFVIYNTDALNLTSSVTGEGALTYRWEQVTSGATASTRMAGNTLGAKSSSFGSADAATTTVNYTPAMETQILTFKLTVSNGSYSASDLVQVTVKDRIDEAVKAGNPALLPADVSELEQRIQDRIVLHQAKLVELHERVFATDAIEYVPSNNSISLVLRGLTSARGVITGNKGNILITASDTDGVRTVAAGDNVLPEMRDGHHSAFAPQAKRLTDWLLQPHGLLPEDEIKVAALLLSDGNMNKSAEWLQSQYANVSLTKCSDEAALSSCLNGAHLIITGSSPTIAVAAVTAALDQAVANQQSLLYVHDRGWGETSLTNIVLAYFGVRSNGYGGNYWANDQGHWSSSQLMRDSVDALGRLAELVRNFQHDSFSFEIASCVDNNCNDVPALGPEFQAATNSLRGVISGFDRSAVDIFAVEKDHFLIKHFILLADKYRETISFPMSIDTVDTREFLKSFYADHLVYTTRQHNPVQNDLGNFSRTDFSHITPINKRVNMVSRRSFKAASVYALPGQTFTVTRTDSNSATRTDIFINTQRSGSTHHLSTNNGYNRPKIVQSHRIPIQAGETLQLTSPYGGPVQIGFADKGVAVSFEFKNVGQHPYWKTGDDDAAFTAALAANEYDWAELATDYFELHQTQEKMLRSVSSTSPSELERYITKYHHNYLRLLAGFKGEDIDVVSEIHDFATTNGYTIREWDRLHHFNGDQATCGSGCSGNPYDAYWAFGALGHGDLHEVGHTVERGRFKFNGFEGHTTTNYYSYYPKSRAMDEDGYGNNCQHLPFSSMLADVQASQVEADPFIYMQERGYSSWSQGALLMVQLAMHAEEKGVLQNGWHLVARLHLIDREFWGTSGDDWDGKRARLGFGTFTRDDARALDNNDWLLIAASYAAGLDYRPFLDLMGLGYSTAADAQLTAFGFPAVDKAFFAPTVNNGYCDSLVQPKHSF